MQNFGVLARLEVAEKFVVGWWWWSRPVLGFSFSKAEQQAGAELGQAQLKLELELCFT